MVWARLEDTFPEHPKIAALSDGAFRLHVRAICYAARYATDGEISPAALRALGAREKLVSELVDAAVWDTTSRGGWAIHDFLDYNPSRETTSARRLSREESGRLGGVRSGEARRSKREASASKQNEANGKQMLQSGGSKNEANASKQNEPRPDPTRFDTPKGVSHYAHAQVREDDDPDESDPLPLEVREVRDMVMAALPGKYQRDELTWQEADQFARDFAGMQREVGEAIAAFRRTEKGLPFPQKLRQLMPASNISKPPPERPPTLAELDEMFLSRPLMPKGVKP